MSTTVLKLQSNEDEGAKEKNTEEKVGGAPGKAESQSTDDPATTSPNNKGAKRKAPSCSTPCKKKSSPRTNWSIGAAKEQLEQAVRDWDNCTGRALDVKTNQRLSLRAYSHLVNIPYHTFRKYAAGKTDRRRVIGQQTGRQPLLDRQEQEWIAQKLAQRGDGWLAQEAVDAVLERHSELTRLQALRHIQRTLLKHNRHKVQVPPKRSYRTKRAIQKTSAVEEDATTATAAAQEEDDQEEVDPGETTANSNSEESASESEEESQVEEDGQNEEEEAKRAQEVSDRTKALEAVDAKIAKLRSDLLDAELEKERLLRGMKS